MSTCKTCKHWDTESGGQRQGMCNKEGFKQVTFDPFNKDCWSSADAFEARASVLDDTGLQLWLVTGPDFGCIHHEEFGEEK